MKLIDTQIAEEESKSTDFIDDGQGVRPYAISCSMKKANGKLIFDFNGTSPQAETATNFYLSLDMFKMLVGYYLLAVFDPYCVVNDGFHDLLEVTIPEGTILRPVRPAPVSCRTHLLGRTLDIIQALMGQRSLQYSAAAGFSDSPHFFYSGFKPNGEWYQLYQVGFGGVPALPIGDGPDCHCLFPAIKSIPTEAIELNFPLSIEANESLADTGGAGFYRGGNAQRTLYRFLAKGEFSIHDDRWFTKPWGINGGKPEKRSWKKLHLMNGEKKILPSKCDHIKVVPGDMLECVTWGGGGLGDPITRPAEKVAQEVERKLVMIDGAGKIFGVVVNEQDFSVDVKKTENLRKKMKKLSEGTALVYDRGGTLEELRKQCKEETEWKLPSRSGRKILTALI